MLGALLIALVFNPVSIIISDGCVAANHFASNSAQWLNAPSSIFANTSGIKLMTGAVGACLNTDGGNILDALGVGEMLMSFKNVGEVWMTFICFVHRMTEYSTILMIF
tara:strand:- start:75 stop:398 length:324 start_codon:yes stop_codon:yes gene_type:complete